MWLDAIDLLFNELKDLCELDNVVPSQTGQQHGSVYLNSNWFKVIGHSDLKSISSQVKPCLSRSKSPIWMDTSTTLECQEIAQALGGNEIICRKSGSITIERFTGSANSSILQDITRSIFEYFKIHLVSSFICSILSGKDCPIDTGDGAE